MIPLLWVMAAHATDFWVIQAELPGAQTHLFRATFEEPNLQGTSQVQDYRPDSRHRVGLEVDQGWFEGASGLQPVLRYNLRYADAAVSELDLYGQAVEAGIELGPRAVVNRGQAVEWFAVTTLGTQVAVFQMESWPSLVTAALTARSGMGLSAGGEHVRVVAEGRVALALRIDYLTGHLETVGGAVEWRYFPGSLGLCGVAGIELR